MSGAFTPLLLGLGQKQLAVYHGLEVQYLTQPLCGETGTNRVYFHPVEYNSFGPAGLSVVTRPDATVPTGVKEYPITDHLGSVRVVATGPAPNAYGEADYGTFGEPVTGAPARVGYIEREIDAESELGDYGARKYDPVLGRFLSVDPLWALEPGLSPYVYAHNDPVGFADPWGLSESSPLEPGKSKSTTARDDGPVKTPQRYKDAERYNDPQQSYSPHATDGTYSAPPKTKDDPPPPDNRRGVAVRPDHHPQLVPGIPTGGGPGDGLGGGGGGGAALAYGMFKLVELSYGQLQRLLSSPAVTGATNWIANIFQRGRILERLYGGNLGWNFPAIDKFYSGWIGSIKSFDLRCASYLGSQGAALLQSRIQQCIDRVALFEGRIWGGTPVYGPFRGRVLELAFPAGAASAEQTAAIYRALVYARTVGVYVIVHTSP